jgi:hypothetical protein
VVVVSTRGIEVVDGAPLQVWLNTTPLEARAAPTIEMAAVSVTP